MVTFVAQAIFKINKKKLPFQAATAMLFKIF